MTREMTPTMERRFAKVQGDVQIRLVQRMREREQSIISRLVTAYRSEKLSSEMLFGGIAAISELRAIIHDAESSLMQATDDASKFTS